MSSNSETDIVYTLFERYGLRGKRMFGHMYQPHCKYETIKYMRETFTSQANDVFITTYPKCGTTWMQEICALIMKYGSNNPSLYTNNNAKLLGLETIPWIEKSDIQTIKNHIQKYRHNNSPITTFPVKLLNKNSKIIIVCRNPKDCLISYYYHTSEVFNDKHYHYNGNLNHFSNAFIQGRMNGGSYWQFYKDYYYLYNYNKLNNYKNILWIYYEDIKNNSKNEIIKIAKFLNQYKNFIDKDRIIEQIIKETSFKEMRQKSGMNKFFRSGKVNSWKNKLTQQQNEHINELNRYYFWNTDFKYVKEHFYSKL